MPKPKIDAVHPEYEAHRAQWKRCRDCYDGSDAVKSEATLYLPAPEVFAPGTPGGDGRYLGYLKRALFFNATNRTVDGAAGSIFQKEPEFEGVDEKTLKAFEDVTQTATTASLHMLKTGREVLITGRSGVLVDWANDRPVWARYRGENILNWREDDINGIPTLTLLVLKEGRMGYEDGDPFTAKPFDLFRVLTLIDGVYSQQLWREVNDIWQTAGPLITPTRRGKALDFLPWTWFNPTSSSAAVERPPLLDLVDTNLSHYQISADLKHGLHFCGTPSLVIIGGLNNNGAPIKFGSGNALLLPIGGDAKVLQADSAMLGALENDEKRMRDMMATLGARLLEDAPIVDETATAVVMRHSGEHASLKTLAGVLEQGYNDVIRTHIWWAGGSEADPSEVKASVTLNKEFLATKMSGDDLKSWVMALQAEAVSHKTFWAALIRGGVARDVTSEEEVEQIEDETPEDVVMPNAPLPVAPGQPVPVKPPAKPVK